MNRIDLMAVLTVFCVLFAGFGAEAKAPSSNVLARKVRQQPITEHTDLYIHMSDTMVRQSRPLREALIKTGHEDWYGKYIRGIKLDHVKKMDVESTFTMSRGLSMYRTLMLNVRNKRTIDLWIKLLANSPVSSADVKREAPPWLKRSGPSFLRVLMREVNYMPDEDGQENKKNGWSSNRELRYLSSVGPIPRVAFEASVFHEDELDEGIRRKLEQFSWMVVKDKEELGGWKQFGISFLRHRGVSKNKIEARIRTKANQISTGGEISAQKMEDLYLRDADLWINQYPKWRVDESKIDDDRHKNDRGKDHDKQKGQGH